MKIFATGFQRSGTTMLRDLIAKHPQVKRMFHEQGLLRLSRNELLGATVLKDSILLKERQGGKLRRDYEFAVDFSLKDDTWGEKIPYYQLFIRKGGVNVSLFDYCRRWNEYFGDEARILHIVRHPFDVAISTRRIGYASSYSAPLRVYMRNVPQALDAFKQQFSNVLTIKFEDLVSSASACLRRILSFCALDSMPGVIEGILAHDEYYRFRRIEASRAFSYRTSPAFNTRTVAQRFPGLAAVIDRLNQTPGVRYALR